MLRSTDGGGTWRIVDEETNNLARDQHSDYLDGGGYPADEFFVAFCFASRINSERGLSDEVRTEIVDGDQNKPGRPVLNDPHQVDPPQCYVTLSQMAGIVNRSKSTLERLSRKVGFPSPAIEGGGGRPHEWRWSDVRSDLQQEYGRTLPEIFPADRFLR